MWKLGQILCDSPTHCILVNMQYETTFMSEILGRKNVQSLNNYRTLTNRQQHEMSSLLSGETNNNMAVLSTSSISHA